ncbi:leucine-rich repeat domain-containing protein [Aestuariicella hydrocarbonica]|uniref:Leucine-rich repeat domain-containing protein n=1 Tax=Pseudomaricurvus hydrocarbonicus TaxID=1470433 RepID=A0A9E5JRE6_9GAMM|nr:leucine-rich repeat domain-containing protein [Aestuariicella hydrocarbonica]NHO65144.1 leucine-rich repeat domain-containing protein [Aestuariicella hydrocarbonica]
MKQGLTAALNRFNNITTIVVTSLALAFGLTACSRYQMTFNETVMYSPQGLLTDFTTEDPNLRNCLDQMIKDGNFTTFAEVTRLICSHAGLTSLKGLEAFTNLREINLENNQISSITPLQHLSKLEVVILNDNHLVQVPELLTLPALKEVKLENNPVLECGDLHQLQQNSSSKLQLPGQCR